MLSFEQCFISAPFTGLNRAEIDHNRAEIGFVDRDVSRGIGKGNRPLSKVSCIQQSALLYPVRQGAGRPPKSEHETANRYLNVRYKASEEGLCWLVVSHVALSESRWKHACSRSWGVW